MGARARTASTDRPEAPTASFLGWPSPQPPPRDDFRSAREVYKHVVERRPVTRGRAVLYANPFKQRNAAVVKAELVCGARGTRPGAGRPGRDGGVRLAPTPTPAAEARDVDANADVGSAAASPQAHAADAVEDGAVRADIPGITCEGVQVDWSGAARAAPEPPTAFPPPSGATSFAAAGLTCCPVCGFVPAAPAPAAVDAQMALIPATPVSPTGARRGCEAAGGDDGYVYLRKPDGTRWREGEYLQEVVGGVYTAIDECTEVLERGPADPTELTETLAGLLDAAAHAFFSYLPARGAKGTTLQRRQARGSRRRSSQTSARRRSSCATPTSATHARPAGGDHAGFGGESPFLQTSGYFAHGVSPAPPARRRSTHDAAVGGGGGGGGADASSPLPSPHNVSLIPPEKDREKERAAGATPRSQQGTRYLREGLASFFASPVDSGLPSTPQSPRHGRPELSVSVNSDAPSEVVVEAAAAPPPPAKASSFRKPPRPMSPRIFTSVGLGGGGGDLPAALSRPSSAAATPRSPRSPQPQFAGVFPFPMPQTPGGASVASSCGGGGGGAPSPMLPQFYMGGGGGGHAGGDGRASLSGGGGEDGATGDGDNSLGAQIAGLLRAGVRLMAEQYSYASRRHDDALAAQLAQLRKKAKQDVDEKIASLEYQAAGYARAHEQSSAALSVVTMQLERERMRNGTLQQEKQLNAGERIAAQRIYLANLNRVKQDMLDLRQELNRSKDDSLSATAQMRTMRQQLANAAELAQAEQEMRFVIEDEKGRLFMDHCIDTARTLMRNVQQVYTRMRRKQVECDDEGRPMTPLLADAPQGRMSPAECMRAQLRWQQLARIRLLEVFGGAEAVHCALHAGGANGPLAGANAGAGAPVHASRVNSTWTIPTPQTQHHTPHQQHHQLAGPGALLPPPADPLPPASAALAASGSPIVIGGGGPGSTSASPLAAAAGAPHLAARLHAAEEHLLHVALEDRATLYYTADPSEVLTPPGIWLAGLGELASVPPMLRAPTAVRIPTISLTRRRIHDVLTTVMCAAATGETMGASGGAAGAVDMLSLDQRPFAEYLEQTVATISPPALRQQLAYSLVFAAQGRQGDGVVDVFTACLNRRLGAWIVVASEAELDCLRDATGRALEAHALAAAAARATPSLAGSVRGSARGSARQSPLEKSIAQQPQQQSPPPPPPPPTFDWANVIETAWAGRPTNEILAATYAAEAADAGTAEVDIDVGAWANEKLYDDPDVKATAARALRLFGTEAFNGESPLVCCVRRLLLRRVLAFRTRFEVRLAEVCLMVKGVAVVSAEGALQALASAWETAAPPASEMHGVEPKAMDVLKAYIERVMALCKRAVAVHRGAAARGRQAPPTPETVPSDAATAPLGLSAATTTNTFTAAAAAAAAADANVQWQLEYIVEDGVSRRAGDLARIAIADAPVAPAAGGGGGGAAASMGAAATNPAPGAGGTVGATTATNTPETVGLAGVARVVPPGVSVVDAGITRERRQWAMHTRVDLLYPAAVYLTPPHVAGANGGRGTPKTRGRTPTKRGAAKRGGKGSTSPAAPAARTKSPPVGSDATQPVAAAGGVPPAAPHGATMFAPAPIAHVDGTAAAGSTHGLPAALNRSLLESSARDVGEKYPLAAVVVCTRMLPLVGLTHGQVW